MKTQNDNQLMALCDGELITFHTLAKELVFKMFLGFSKTKIGKLIMLEFVMEGNKIVKILLTDTQEKQFKNFLKTLSKKIGYEDLIIKNALELSKSLGN